MTRKLVHAVVLMILVAAWTMPCFAEETPGTLWVTAKCALCHGEDGRGNTPSGKQMNVRDLRADEIQKKSDEELSKTVSGGHKKMPSFRNRLTAEQVSKLVSYVRDFARKG